MRKQQFFVLWQIAQLSHFCVVFFDIKKLFASFMQQSKVASFEARWPFNDDGSIVNMADEVDLEKNEGDTSFHSQLPSCSGKYW